MGIDVFRSCSGGARAHLPFSIEELGRVGARGMLMETYIQIEKFRNHLDICWVSTLRNRLYIYFESM